MHAFIMCEGQALMSEVCGSCDQAEEGAGEARACNGV